MGFFCDLARAVGRAGRGPGGGGPRARLGLRRRLGLGRWLGWQPLGLEGGEVVLVGPGQCHPGQRLGQRATATVGRRLSYRQELGVRGHGRHVPGALLQLGGVNRAPAGGALGPLPLGQDGGPHGGGSDEAVLGD